MRKDGILILEHPLHSGLRGPPTFRPRSWVVPVVEAHADDSRIPVMQRNKISLPIKHMADPDRAQAIECTSSWITP